MKEGSLHKCALPKRRDTRRLLHGVQVAKVHAACNREGDTLAMLGQHETHDWQHTPHTAQQTTGTVQHATFYEPTYRMHTGTMAAAAYAVDMVCGTWLLHAVAWLLYAVSGRCARSEEQEPVRLRRCGASLGKSQQQ